MHPSNMATFQSASLEPWLVPSSRAMISRKREQRPAFPSAGAVVQSPALAYRFLPGTCPPLQSWALAFCISSLHPSPTLNAPTGTVCQLSCVD